MAPRRHWRYEHGTTPRRYVKWLAEAMVARYSARVKPIGYVEREKDYYSVSSTRAAERIHWRLSRTRHSCRSYIRSSGAPSNFELNIRSSLTMRFDNPRCRAIGVLDVGSNNAF